MKKIGENSLEAPNHVCVLTLLCRIRYESTEMTSNIPKIHISSNYSSILTEPWFIFSSSVNTCPKSTAQIRFPRINPGPTFYINSHILHSTDALHIVNSLYTQTFVSIFAMANPKVYFDMAVGGTPVGKIDRFY